MLIKIIVTELSLREDTLDKNNFDSASASLSYNADHEKSGTLHNIIYDCYYYVVT